MWDVESIFVFMETKVIMLEIELCWWDYSIFFKNLVYLHHLYMVPVTTQITIETRFSEIKFRI